MSNRNRPLTLTESLELLREVCDNTEDYQLAGLIRDILDVYEEEEE